MGLGEGALLELNHLLGRFHFRAWIIGEGRSGTTWLSTLIDPDRRFRHLFEPFHPHRSPEIADAFLPYQYLRRGACHDPLQRFSRRVFTGRYRSDRTRDGSGRLLYDGLVVKDIFANLLAGWVHHRHPDVRIVLLLRHPFDVARSKVRLDEWHWFREPIELTRQSELMKDHLGPYEDTLVGARTQFSKYVVLWCVSTLVTLRSFSQGQIQIVFYESLRHDLHATLESLFRFFELPMPDSDVLERVANRPSRTSRSKNGEPVVARLDDGFQGVGSAEVRRGFEIIDDFSLGELYNRKGVPNPTAASELLSPC